MSAAAFQATYADFKLIKSRGQAQFVFEVPLDKADAALKALGGLPRPDQETWVGVARLKGAEPIAIPAPKERKRFDELTPAAQAGMRCQDEKFVEFLHDRNPDWLADGSDDDEAAQMVRQICGVESRSELNSDAIALSRWKGLEADFQTWLRFGNG